MKIKIAKKVGGWLLSVLENKWRWLLGALIAIIFVAIFISMAVDAHQQWGIF
jgi:hypothetical protein